QTGVGRGSTLRIRWIDVCWVHYPAPAVAHCANAGCGDNRRALVIRNARLLVVLRLCPYDRIGMARKSPASGRAGGVSGTGSFVSICQRDHPSWSWAGIHIFLVAATIRVAHRMAGPWRGTDPSSSGWANNRVVRLPINTVVKCAAFEIVC